MKTKAQKNETPLPHVLLQRAIREFKNGKRWTKGTLKRNRSKRWPEGAFCSIGMLHHINTPNQHVAMDFLEKSVQTTTRNFSIAGFNDASSTTWEKVKAVFKNAVVLAKEAGK